MHSCIVHISANHVWNDEVVPHHAHSQCSGDNRVQTIVCAPGGVTIQHTHKYRILLCEVTHSDFSTRTPIKAGSKCNVLLRISGRVGGVRKVQAVWQIFALSSIKLEGCQFVCVNKLLQFFFIPSSGFWKLKIDQRSVASPPLDNGSCFFGTTGKQMVQLLFSDVLKQSWIIVYKGMNPSSNVKLILNTQFNNILERMGKFWGTDTQITIKVKVPVINLQLTDRKMFPHNFIGISKH